MRTVVVIGGGMGGLAAARVLAGAGPVSGVAPPAAAHVIVLEASSRLGGKVQTHRLGEGGVEVGPDQFLRRDPSAERLCRHLGLGDDLVAPAGGTAAVWANGALRQLPSGLVLGVPTDLSSLQASGIVSEEAVLYLSAESDRDHGRLGPAELGLDDGTDPTKERSAGAILRPRLGREVVERLVEPLLGGINAGSLDGLSLGTTAPQIAQALVGQGEVLASLRDLAAANSVAASSAPAPSVAAHLRPAEPSSGTRGQSRSPFLGLAGGLGRLADEAAKELAGLGCDVRCDSPARAVTRERNGAYTVTTDRGHLTADAIVIGVPASQAAQLLANVSEEAAAIFRSISYASVAVTTMAFASGERAAIEGWTGALIPRTEGAVSTAVTFLSAKWPWIAEERGGDAVIRVSAGSRDDPRASELSDGKLTERLLAELRHFTGLVADARPTQVEVTRWPSSFPQYAPGHRARIALLRHHLEKTPGIAVAGALLGGIGIPACITSGESAATSLQAHLA